MDTFYIDPSVQDSRQCRSRSNSHLSATAAQFQDLDISNLPLSDRLHTHSSGSHHSSDLRTTSPSGHLDQGSHPSPRTIVTAPVPQQYIPFPLFSEPDLDANWSYLNATEGHIGSAPLLRLDPAQSFTPEHHLEDQRSIRSNSNPTTMSTLSIQQFDSQFDASMQSGLRHNYTWPQFEISEQYTPQNPSPGLHPGQLTPLYDEPKLLPIYARSLSSSPPRVGLTPEQRELKRQRDYARRDSKSQVRRDRSASNTSNLSNPYLGSQNVSPDLLPRTLPEYTNTLTPSPLLSQGSLHSSPALGSNSFLSTYSPALSDSGPSDMYGPVFTMGPNDFTSNPVYPVPYSTTGGEPGLQAFAGRPHSLSLSSVPEPGSLYRAHQVSPKMGSTESGDHVRVVNSRPKPQCWEHGCNGRQFSTFSNLLRHQREKSGAAQKSSCPNCGAEFTRTTARNGHMAHDKCKAQRNS